MVWEKIRRTAEFLRAFLPSRLPTSGLPEFTEFSDSIFSLYSLPDLPSYRHAIASMIMHLGPTTASKSKYFFGASIRKAMANQIAYEVIQAIKKQELDAKSDVKEGESKSEVEKEESSFDRSESKTGSERSH